MSEIKIEKKYISTGKLEKELSKYYFDSSSMQEMVNDVIKDLQRQADELMSLSIINEEELMKARITPSHRLLR